MSSLIFESDSDSLSHSTLLLVQLYGGDFIPAVLQQGSSSDPSGGSGTIGTMSEQCVSVKRQTSESVHDTAQLALESADTSKHIPAVKFMQRSRFATLHIRCYQQISPEAGTE